MAHSQTLLLSFTLQLLSYFFHCLKPSLCLNYNYSSNYIPPENIAIDCGSMNSNNQSYDNRNWTSDVGLEKNITNVSTYSSSLDPLVPQIPYKTARLFHSNFTYTFNVTPGFKFVRLHFYPNGSFPGLDSSKSFLSVTSGNYSLLRNFSASLMASYLQVSYFFKEFIVPVENNHSLDLTFSPDSFITPAFVNGIEVVSIPPNLYVNEDNPIPLVGFDNVNLWLARKSAMETAYRINVGGQTIAPKQDNGMFRTWTMDDPHIFGSAFGVTPYDMDVSISYSPSVPAYTAPESVYKTARSMGPFSEINLNYNLSWYFPVDTGFMYLVRLHFCEVERNITMVNQRVFSIYINNQTAEVSADVIAWSGGYGTPVYEDYLVLVPRLEDGVMEDLWLGLHPSKWTKPEYYDAILNGVEIFKLSNYDGNLAGLNPVPPPLDSDVRGSSSKKKRLVMGCLLGGLILLATVSLAVWLMKVRRPRESGKSSSNSLVFRSFSFSELKAATNNFDESRVIGSGGFGKVYKGYINGGMTPVAIKRGNPEGQGNFQFDSEITILSQLHHQNIVSLLGYCNEDNEKILVYEYMSNGSLFEHLHMSDQLQRSPLSWNQRLSICVGAARGLHYLHTGTKQSVIHRDIKASNILIDSNWAGKVSDFGLSKVCPSMDSPSAAASNKIKGSVGYLDPEYYNHHRLTEKSDVYSFGVVLLEVLSSRQVVNLMEDVDDESDNDRECLVEWGLGCLRNGDIDQLVDSRLKEEINPGSLAIFLEATKKCLSEHSKDRPSMSELLWSLESALQLQLVGYNDSNVCQEDKTESNSMQKNSDVMLGIEFSEIMMPMGR